ncbi:MAG: NADH-quinone oxidoreductase subunit A [Candidatus Bathyarchaeia archaeon]
MELLTSLPFALFVSLITALLLYWYGGRISARGAKIPGKLSQYACGEELPAEKLQVNVERFFVYAVYFLVFDILAFMLATSLGNLGIIPVLYAVITLLAIILLLPMLEIRAS